MIGTRVQCRRHHQDTTPTRGHHKHQFPVGVATRSRPMFGDSLSAFHRGSSGADGYRSAPSTSPGRRDSNHHGHTRPPRTCLEFRLVTGSMPRVPPRATFPLRERGLTLWRRTFYRCPEWFGMGWRVCPKRRPRAGHRPFCPRRSLLMERFWASVDHQRVSGSSGIGMRARYHTLLGVYAGGHQSWARTLYSHQRE